MVRKLNQKADDGQITQIGDNARGALRDFVRRLENLAEDRAAINEDMKQVRAEAKAAGFDPKILNKVLAERKKDRAAREEQQALFEMYWDAVEDYLAMEASEEAEDE